MIRGKDFRTPPVPGQNNKLFKPLRLLLGLLLLAVLALASFGASPMSAMLQERPAVGLELIAGDLTAPVTLVEAPDKTGRLFIVDQIGMIWIVDNGNVLSTPFLDVQDRMVSLNPGYDERGLLGLAFHPDYATNGRFFVYYNAPLSPTAPPRLQPHQSPL